MDTATCFRLGRALRYGDAESFLDAYDSLSLADGRDFSQSQLEDVKEFARLVSELPNEDFSLLQTQATTPHSLTALTHPPHSPPSDQLASLLDKLRLEVCSSDSGAVSDFESSVGDKSSVCGVISRRGSLLEEEGAVACVKVEGVTTTSLPPSALDLEGPGLGQECGMEGVGMAPEGSKTVGESAKKGHLGRRIGSAGDTGRKGVPRAADSVESGRLTLDMNLAHSGQSCPQSHCDSFHPVRRNRGSRTYRHWETSPRTDSVHVSNSTHSAGAHFSGRRKGRFWKGKNHRHNRQVCAGTESAWSRHLQVVHFLHSQWQEVHRELHRPANTQTCA